MNKEERDAMRARLSEKKSLDLKKTTLCGLITLNPKITPVNYIASLIHALCLGFLGNGVELIQQNLLVDPRYYNHSSEDAVKYNSLITSEDLLIKILVTPFFGVMVDRYGRKKMLFIAYFLIIIALALFPIRHYSDSFNHLGWYFGIRFIYSCAAAITPILPFTADFVDRSTTGRAIGLSCLFISLGFSVSTYVVNLLTEYDPFYTYVFFTSFSLVVGTSYTLCLKSGNSYYKTPRSSFNVETGHHIIGANENTKQKRLLMVKNDCKTKPWIVVSYNFAFLNGIGLAIMTQLLNLYVQSFDVPDKENLGTKVVFKSNIASFVASLLLGPMLDKVKPIYIGTLAIVSSLFAYGSIWAIEDPRDILMTFIAIGIGVSYSCSLLMAKYLGFKNYRTSIRGLLFSIANILIMFGVVSIVVIGGNLFQIDKNIPFYIAVGAGALCAFLFVYLYCGSIRKQEKNQAKVGPTTPLAKDGGGFEIKGDLEQSLDEEDDEVLDKSQGDENEESKKTDEQKGYASDGQEKVEN